MGSKLCPLRPTVPPASICYVNHTFGEIFGDGSVQIHALLLSDLTAEAPGDSPAFALGELHAQHPSGFWAWRFLELRPRPRRHLREQDILLG